MCNNKSVEDQISSEPKTISKIYPLAPQLEHEEESNTSEIKVQVIPIKYSCQVWMNVFESLKLQMLLFDWDDY